jgi:hypothetical protein
MPAQRESIRTIGDAPRKLAGPNPPPSGELYIK